jgi:hypothetical protein
VDERTVVRSIDWAKRNVTLEVIHYSEPWMFDYVDASFEEFYDAGLELDREYCAEVLAKMEEYADPKNNRCTHKVPKQTFNRIQQQRKAII